MFMGKMDENGQGEKSVVEEPKKLNQKKAR